MTDARFPERWLSDRRVLRLSPLAFRLFALGLLWSVSNRTDGRIEAADLPLVPGASDGLVAELVAAGLWAVVPEGWIIPEFGSTQTSRHELEVLENARRREREKKARQRGSRGTVPGDKNSRPEGLSRGTKGSVPGDVPGDSPGDLSPGTAQDRTGQAHPPLTGGVRPAAPRPAPPVGQGGPPPRPRAHAGDDLGPSELENLRREGEEQTRRAMEESVRAKQAQADAARRGAALARRALMREPA